jgi:hypothetical protein
MTPMSLYLILAPSQTVISYLFLLGHGWIGMLKNRDFWPLVFFMNGTNKDP